MIWWVLGVFMFALNLVALALVWKDPDDEVTIVRLSRRPNVTRVPRDDVA